MPGVPPVLQPGFTPLVAVSALHCALRWSAGDGWQCGTNQLLAQVAQGLATGTVTEKALVSSGTFGRGAGGTGPALAGDVPVTADAAAARALASSGPDIAAIQMRVGRSNKGQRAWLFLPCETSREQAPESGSRCPAPCRRLLCRQREVSRGCLRPAAARRPNAACSITPDCGSPRPHHGTSSR